MDAPDGNQKGYKNLFLQIFQLKNFLLLVGGGALFIPIYTEQAKWVRVQPFFAGWVIIVAIWFLLILFEYRGQLVERVIAYLMEVAKKLIPLIFMVLALYLILFPFDYSKTLGTILLIFVMIRFLQGSKKLQNVSNNILNGHNRAGTTKAEGWIATETNNRQGTDYREINLEGKSLKMLEFRVKPSSAYWRVGFKVTDSNGIILPLRTESSLLFHIGSTESENKLGVTAYLNSKWISYLNKTLDFKRNSFIAIKFEVNEKNFVKCFINDKIEFELKERIDPQILKKVFLATWGDGNPYRVEINSVDFTTK